MKKFFLVICLCCLCYESVIAELHEYISDTGDIFYYSTSPTSDNESNLVCSQIIDVSVATKSQNYSKEEALYIAKEEYKELIYELYLKNKDYMWDNFAQYRYTFNDAFEMIYKLSYVMTYYGFDNNVCEVYIKLDIPNIISTNNGRKKLARYPYILGYVYKGEIKN
jgi:hypothetical protein